MGQGHRMAAWGFSGITASGRKKGGLERRRPGRGKEATSGVRVAGVLPTEGWAGQGHLLSSERMTRRVKCRAGVF